MKTFDESSEQHVNVGKECRGKWMTFLKQNFSPRHRFYPHEGQLMRLLFPAVYIIVDSSMLSFPNKMHIVQSVCNVL